MEKIIKYIPLTLFTAFVLKALILGALLTDAPVLLILGLIAAFYEYQFQNKAVEKVHKRLSEVDKHLTALYKTDQEMRNEIATAKLGHSVRAMASPVATTVPNNFGNYFTGNQVATNG